MKTFNLRSIAGDALGKRVVPEGIRVLEAAGKRFGFQFNGWIRLELRHLYETGKMMPSDGLQQLRAFDRSFWELSSSDVQITSRFGD